MSEKLIVSWEDYTEMNKHKFIEIKGIRNIHKLNFLI